MVLPCTFAVDTAALLFKRLNYLSPVMKVRRAAVTASSRFLDAGLPLSGKVIPGVRLPTAPERA